MDDEKYESSEEEEAKEEEEEPHTLVLRRSVRDKRKPERYKTTPYTPQQNGVAERMNMTLMEKARSMLSGVELGQEFWAEVVGIACYLVNRSPSSTLNEKTPHRYGLLGNPLFNILECLVVMLMYMFQRRIGVR